MIEKVNTVESHVRLFEWLAERREIYHLPSHRQQGLHPAEMERGKGRQAKSEGEDCFTGIVKYVILLHC